MREIPRHFWHPTVTTQFCVCPVPFHFDTYRGCQYGCLFCFARDFIQFSRRNKDESERKQSFLEGNDPKGLERWCERVLAGGYDYTKADRVAFKERIPVKIGATADPFPMCEQWEHITYDCLKVFGKYDYPVQISTKNPEIFLSYAEDFKGANIALNISCSFCDDDVARKIEVGAISPTRRFDAMKKLSDMGFKITVRIQPFILPYSEKVADRFIKTLKDYGAYGFQTEGLKIRLAMPETEKAIYRRIGEVFGFDILGDFKKNGMIEGGDRCYNIEDKRRMLQLWTDTANKYGIKFFNADNLIDSRYGCGAECCGTDFLRDHKVWGGSRRSLAFPEGMTPSEEFGKCLVNFTRSTANSHRTIAEVTAEYVEKEDRRIRQMEACKQPTLFDL